MKFYYQSILFKKHVWYNYVKVVLVLKRIEFNCYYESKNNITELGAFKKIYIFLETCLYGIKNYLEFLSQV